MKPFCILATVALAAMLCAPVLAAPKLSAPRVTPASGAQGELFTFTVNYAGEMPASVQVFINDVPHEMQEVDSTDRNATDGKDYYLRIELEEGVSIYYFKATPGSGEDVRTTAATINVRPPTGIRLDHLDVVFAVLIFLIPTAWGLLMFRRLSRDIRGILESIKKDDERSE